MAQQIPVQFRGDGAGTEELTWGQLVGWGSMQGTGITASAGGTMPLPEGTTVEGIATLLGYIMSRHQSLRTKIEPGTDGQPWQVLYDCGEVNLEVVDAADHENPVEVAEAIRQRYEDRGWATATDWPVRMAVVRHRGVAVQIVAMYSHLVIDGYGFEALVADLANMDAATGAPLAPVAGMQPMEQARQQRTPAARKQSQASLRRWERQLRAITPARFGPSDDPREPRWWEASYRSPAGNLALAVIAERTKVHTGAILLAAYAVALGRATASSPSVVRILVSNRFRPGFAESVSPITQSALCVIDVADGSFDDVIDRTFKAQLAAGMHAYYEPRDLWGLIERVNQERGITLDLMCYFNDRRRSLAQAAPGPAPTADQVRAALARSELRWGNRWSHPDASSYLHINSEPDTLDYTLRVDTHCLSPDGLERCLRDIESVLVQAAFEPSAPTGVHPADVPAAAG